VLAPPPSRIADQSTQKRPGRFRNEMARLFRASTRSVPSRWQSSASVRSSAQRFAIPSRKKGLGARALILEIFFLACPARTARLGSPFWQAALDKQRKASSPRGVRDEDRYFVRTLLVERLIDPRRLYRRLHQLPNNPKVTTELIAAIEEWIGGVLKDIRSHA
jgi:hypothetical protein